MTWFGQQASNKTLVCYACFIDPTGTQLTDEHFLPEVIGGRRAVPTLCQKHNSDTGHKLDAALGELFQAFRVCLGLVPASGRKPKQYHALPFLIDGTEYLMDSKGDAYLKKPSVEKLGHVTGSIQMRISAAPSDLDVILEQLKAKYPNLSIGDFTHPASNASGDKNLLISVRLTSENIRRAITKIGIGFAASLGIPPQTMEKAIRFCIRGGGEEVVSHLHERVTNLLERRKFNHTIVLSGCSSTGLLVAFVELFACAPSLVLLSSEYNGPDLIRAYSLDPISGKEEHCNAEVSLGKREFDAIFKTGDDIPKGYGDDFTAGIASAQGYQRWSREVSEAIDTSIAFMKSKGRQELTKDAFPVFWEHFEEGYVLPRMSRRRNEIDLSHEDGPVPGQKPTRTETAVKDPSI